MKVVSDTTPLSELAKIDRVEILRDIYGEILIPQQVYDEVTVGLHPAAKLVGTLSWIKVEQIKNIDALSQLRDLTRLGQGECAAMLLADEIGADQLLIDDLSARRVALSQGLPVVGTMGTLLVAKQQGVVESVKDILDGLIKRGKWVHPRLYDEVLGLANER